MEQTLLMQRVYDPPVGSVLYHYCSATGFEEIVKSRKSRFSDINMMNDADEVRWGYRVFERAARELMKLSTTKATLAGLTREFFDRVDQIIASIQLIVHPFVASFSREPDLLGQWREYADSGRGFSIGFDAQALKNMPVTLLSVEYDEASQIEEMKDALGAIYLENAEDGNSFGSKFRESCRLLGNLMAAFKNPTFAEEREVRSLHFIIVEGTGRSAKLIDVGGFIGQAKAVDGETIQYRLSNGNIVAFVDIAYDRDFHGCPIKEVILGPKNTNLAGNVLYFLNSKGCEVVIIRKSASSYR